MNLDSRFKFPDPGSNLYEFESYRRKLGVSPLSSTKMKPAKCMQKNISGRMEKKPKLVSFKTAAGGAVGEKMVLMLFDEKFSLSSSAVDRLIDKTLVPVFKVSHDITLKQPESVALHFDDNPLCLWPALCLMEKLTEHFYRLLLSCISFLGFLHKLLRLFFQGLIRLEPKNIFYLLLLAELIHSRTTIIRVTTKKDPHIRPGLPDPFYHPLKDRNDLLTCGTLSRTEYRGYQLPTSPFIDMDRHIAVVVMKSIEEGQLLMAMCGIIGIIYIQDDRLCRLLIRFEKNIQKHLGYSVKICMGESVLETVDGRLTGQRRITLRQSLAGHLQHRLIHQLVGIIAVFIAAGNLKDSLLEKLDDLMFDISGMSTIPKHLGYPVKKPHLSLYFTQEKKPVIRADFAPLEVCLHLFSINIFKKKQLFGIMILFQSCFLLYNVLTYYKTIRYEEKQLFFWCATKRLAIGGESP